MSRAPRLVAVLLALLSATAAAGQSTPELGARFGIASPHRDYTSGCGYSHPGLSLEGRGRGTSYHLITVAAYGEGGGSDVLCVGGGQGEGTWTYRDGGADPAGAVRVTAGWGRRIPLRWVAIESEGAVGVLRARPGYDESGSIAGARLHPVGTVAVGATVLRHLHVGWEQTWTRLRYRDEVHPWHPFTLGAPLPQPGTGLFEVRESARWSPMNEVRVGIRF